MNNYLQENKVQLIDAGLLNYSDAWDLQKQLFNEVTEKRNVNYLLLTEHPPVITMGKSSEEKNIVTNRKLLQSRNIDIIEIDRGGDVTFHAQGQIIGYPILNLEYFKKDIHWYLRSIEEVIIQTLDQFGIIGQRINGLTGVWVNNRKICAIGIKVTRWVTMHGFALNVNTQLDYFNHIIPCGINDKSVTSMQELKKQKYNLQHVKETIINSFEKIFAVKMEKREYVIPV